MGAQSALQNARGFTYLTALKPPFELFEYDPMTSILKNVLLQSMIGLAAVATTGQAAAQVTFYENNDFQGRSFSTGQRIANFTDAGFNDRASSVIVLSNRWEVCEHAQFDGRCVVLRPGRYPSLQSMGMNNTVSSIRAVNNRTRINDDRYAPPEQRCWIEREQAMLQNQNQTQTQGVRRCVNVPSQARPDLWDVSYTFRGIEHRLQMTTPPGPTVTVNRNGEPRA